MKHWFLPETPDVLATLNRQADITCEGIAAFVRWAHSSGDGEPATAVLAAEESADEVRRELAQQLRTAFTTPVDQEDLFTLSERLDAVLNMAKNVVRDAELLGMSPDGTTAAMADAARDGVTHLAAALRAIPDDPTAATEQADAATRCGRTMERLYSEALRAVVRQADPHAALIRHEHLQDCLKVGERIELVADRIWYSVVKEQ